jgi:hypothetical protein
MPTRYERSGGKDPQLESTAKPVERARCGLTKIDKPRARPRAAASRNSRISPYMSLRLRLGCPQVGAVDLHTSHACSGPTQWVKKPKNYGLSRPQHHAGCTWCVRGRVWPLRLSHDATPSRPQASVFRPPLFRLHSSAAPLRLAWSAAHRDLRCAAGEGRRRGRCGNSLSAGGPFLPR